jgi:hypothetical protein
MAETPLYRRLGAKPESPAPKGRRPLLRRFPELEIWLIKGYIGNSIKC